MPSTANPPSHGKRIQARRSGVHGKGVFAVQDIAAGETIIEYRGEVISWDEAQRRHPHDPSQPNHTFYFHVEELNYDYGLIIEERYTPKLKAEYACWCGAPTCRGTMLAPKRGWRPPMPEDFAAQGTTP